MFLTIFSHKLLKFFFERFRRFMFNNIMKRCNKSFRCFLCSSVYTLRSTKHLCEKKRFFTLVYMFRSFRSFLKFFCFAIFEKLTKNALSLKQLRSGLWSLGTNMSWWDRWNVCLEMKRAYTIPDNIPYVVQ